MKDISVTSGASNRGEIVISVGGIEGTVEDAKDLVYRLMTAIDSLETPQKETVDEETQDQSAVNSDPET